MRNYVILFLALGMVLFLPDSMSFPSQSRSVVQYATNYQILSIPTLEVDITIEDIFINDEEMDIIKNDINEATVNHLSNYTKKEFRVNNLSFDHEFRLDVGVHRMTSSWKYMDRPVKLSSDNYLRAEIAGYLILSYPTSQGSVDIKKHNISNIVIAAFSGHEPMLEYLNSVKDQDSLSTTNSIQVKINVGHNYEDEGFLRDPEIFDENVNPPSGETVASLVLGASLLILLSAFYCHFSRVHRDKTRNRLIGENSLLPHSERHSDETEGDIEKHSKDDNTRHLKAYDQEFVLQDSYSFIPVPARQDELGLNKTKSNIPKEITPRRYVQPASPFDVLYGAAFSHKDYERVEKAHETTKFSRRNSSTTKKRPKKHSSLKPMMSISEGEEEYTTENSSGQQQAFFPHLVTSISSYLTEKRYSLARTAENEGENGGENGGENVDKDEVIFRDFPKKDGTPCIMFSSEGGDITNEHNEKVRNLVAQYFTLTFIFVI